MSEIREIETMEKLLSNGTITTGGCIEWNGARSKAGYGQTRIGGKLFYLHRLIYELKNGAISKGMCICHTCDNPACFSLAHLFIGTRKDNMQDMSKKKRSPKTQGERCGKAKLKSAQIEEMKKRRMNGELLSSIAGDYGIHPAHVSRIVSGKRWAHAS